MQTQFLMQCLTHTPWKQQIALLAAHHLPRTANQTKAAVAEQLHYHLTQPNTISAIIAQLDPYAKDALRALTVANGALPVHTFEERFGPLRPYKPWRNDDGAGDPQPWLAPISATETLWYLGLIFRNPPKRQPGIVQQYLIPSDLHALLTAHLDEPSVRHEGVTVSHPGRNGPLDHHLAIWLATVHAGMAGNGVKPVHQRWLPPSVVALLCIRLGLDQEPHFTSIRSERHHPYLAFLHYLALAADLVAVTPTACQLTPAAWAWLAAAPASRHEQLVAGWDAAPLDLAHPFGFRWEPLSPQARRFLREQVARISAAQPVALTDLVHQWRLLDSRALLPAPRPADWRDEGSLYDPLGELITGPLHWLGFVSLIVDGGTVGSGTFFIRKPTAVIERPSSHCTMPKQPPNTIIAGINIQPLHLVHLARFCDWAIATTPAATPRPHTFTPAPERIGRLAAQGINPDQLLEQVAAALGRAPSRRTIQRIQQWARPGQQLRLRPLLVLEADSAERLAQLRRHKLVRNCLGEAIAPNRVALNPSAADALAQTLRTLGYYVEPPAASGASSPALVEGNDALVKRVPALVEGTLVGLTPALQWFLITLYQGLGQHLPLPIDLPWELRQELRGHLTALQQAGAESAAHSLLDHLQAALNGYLQLSPWHLPPTADPEPIIRRALDQGQDIEIRYWGPTDGHVTTRTVTPYWIEERHSTRYLIGWCHLRQQERVFRLDRIAAISQTVA